MKSMEPLPLSAPLCELGEAPCWDEREGVLLWVDIMQAHIHRLCPETGKVETVRAPEYISTLIPCKDGGWLAAAYHSLYYWGPGKDSFEELLRMEHLPEQVRFNDGKAGPDGRLWVGTMSMRWGERTGALFRVGPDLVCTEILSGIACSNGLDWNAACDRLYYIDSGEPCIQSFRYDMESGTIGEPETSICIEKHTDGAVRLHDGMCMDEDGMLWAAQWGGSRVARWNPADGKLAGAIDVPALQPTSCAFGGAGYETLYITSAYEKMNADLRDKYPLSGGLFQVHTGDLGIKGRRPNRFG